MYVWPFTSVLDDQARLLQLASVCGGICGLVFVILGLVISLEIFIVLLVYQMITYPGEVSTALLFLICVFGAALVTILACLFASLFIYFRRRKLYSQRRVAERRRRPPGACATIYEGKFGMLQLRWARWRSNTVTCAYALMNIPRTKTRMPERSWSSLGGDAESVTPVRSSITCLCDLPKRHSCGSWVLDEWQDRSRPNRQLQYDWKYSPTWVNPSH